MDTTLNKIQTQDSNKCDEMQSIGKDKECWDCSCNVCLAQQPDYYTQGYNKGFEKALTIIEDVIERTENKSHRLLIDVLQVELKNLRR